MKDRKFQPIIYALLIIAGISIGSQINKTSPNKGNEKINGIIELINEHYVDSINRTNFEDKTIEALLSELDPHSSYIPKKEFKAVAEDMQGSFSGIGVQFNIIDDSIVVVAAISGGPSEKLGIQSGDRIVTVEEEDVASIGIKNEDVIKRLRGEKGSIVNIEVRRKGAAQLLSFAIKRDDIPLYSIDASIMLNDDIGYIKINRFAATTYSEFQKGIRTLKEKGMQNLILDLRGNPGGYMGVAIDICDEILDNNKLIVYTQGRNRDREDIYATASGTLKQDKIIVLIDEGSASASEIVSGAVQDNDRGTIIGRRSFGKGLVQEQIGINDGSAVRITTQRYYTPSGRCIQKPYGENKKEYYLEHYKRTDSLIAIDSLKYTTLKGRTVYGGGGITPDIIIKRDTSLNYFQINLMVSKGWVNEYCLKQSEQLKQQNINSYTQIKTADIYSNYLDFINNKDTSFKLELGNTEFNYFNNLLLATISRNLWDNKIYYSILSTEDEYIQRAINEF